MLVSLAYGGQGDPTTSLFLSATSLSVPIGRSLSASCKKVGRSHRGLRRAYKQSVPSRKQWGQGTILRRVRGTHMWLTMPHARCSFALDLPGDVFKGVVLNAQVRRIGTDTDAGLEFPPGRIDEMIAPEDDIFCRRSDFDSRSYLIL